MNGNDRDPRNGFYNGYTDQNGFYNSNTDPEQNDFYTGYTDPAQSNFYNGYTDAPQDAQGSFNGNSSDPYGMPEPDPIAMYNDIRGRKVVNYDFFGFGAVSMETVRSMHPNARLAGPVEARSRLIKLLIVGGIILAIGLLYMGLYLSKDAAQTELLNNSEVVDAQLENVLPGQKFPESMLGIKSYDVSYRYHYIDNYYGDTDQLTLDQLHMVGLDKTSKKEDNIYIKINVDKNDPHRTLLIRENYIGRGSAFLAVFAVIAVIFFIAGFKRYSDCMSGKTAVYINETGKTIYQKIK